MDKCSSCGKRIWPFQERFTRQIICTLGNPDSKLQGKTFVTCKKCHEKAHNE